MTGVSPWRLGALNAFELGQDLSQRNGFLPQVTTIAEILRENGYYTFLSGKWHLGGMREEFRVDRVNHSSCQNPGPSQHGYEEYISELDGPESPRYTFNLIESSDTLRADNLHTHGHRYLYRDDIPVPLEDGNRGFLSPWPTNKEYSYPSVPGTLKAYEELSSRYYPFKGDPNPNPRDPSHQYVLSDREAMDALEFMRRHQAAEPDQPWFVEVSFNAPHGPWERLDAGENVYDEMLGVSKSHWDGHKCTWRGHEEKLVGTKLWKYKTMISAMDRSLGLLLSGLEELGLEKDTFVIFTSDNGPEQGAGTAGRYKQSKRSLQEGGIRVPAFFQVLLAFLVFQLFFIFTSAFFLLFSHSFFL
jgi:arylsulfatase A-like enzyme